MKDPTGSLAALMSAAISGRSLLIVAPSEQAAKERFADLSEAIKEMAGFTPPPLKTIFASLSVPFGRQYRMWRTDGRYDLYVNRFTLQATTDAMPKFQGYPIFTCDQIVDSSLTGVPVVESA